MDDVAHKQFDAIPSFLGVRVGDLEDLMPNQIAIAGYFCDNLDQPMAGQRYLARQLRYVSQSEKALPNALDLGDVNVFPLELDKHFSAVIAQCGAVLETGARMVLVGGDSSGLKALGFAGQKITGANVPVVSVEAGVTFGWSQYADVSVGIDRFGASAPGSTVLKNLGISVENVAEQARVALSKSK